MDRHDKELFDNLNKDVTTLKEQVAQINRLLFLGKDEILEYLSKRSPEENVRRLFDNALPPFDDSALFSNEQQHVEIDYPYYPGHPLAEVDAYGNEREFSSGVPTGRILVSETEFDVTQTYVLALEAKLNRIRDLELEEKLNRVRGILED